MRTVYDVTMVRDMTYRRVHYPSYHVRRDHVGTSSSLEGAEKLMQEISGTFDDIHHFNIREIPLDCISHTGECLKEWLYDRSGTVIDRRMISSMRANPGEYAGRTPGQIRFAEGDIVEVQDGDEIHLGFVVALPPSVENAARVNSAPFFHMDDSDDSYVVLTTEDYRSHEHVDSLMAFRPLFKIHPGVERRLRTAYQNYLTSDMRDRIAMTTAIGRIRQTMAVSGLECLVEPYCQEMVMVTVPDRPEKGDNTVIRIDARKAFNHLDRVLLTLQRYAGRPRHGRGYSLHYVGDNPQDGSVHIFEMK